jgi:hypothetical protein
MRIQGDSRGQGFKCLFSRVGARDFRLSLGPSNPSPLDRQVPHKPRLAVGVKEHNMNEISFAHILFATGAPGKPRPVAGKLHLLRGSVVLNHPPEEKDNGRQN